jgi:hypothetical protein
MGTPRPDTGSLSYRAEHDTDHQRRSWSLRGVLGGRNRWSPRLSCPPHDCAVLSGTGLGPLILIFYFFNSKINTFIGAVLYLLL